MCCSYSVTMLLQFTIAAAAAVPAAFYARGAHEHYTRVYLPAWQKIFLKEGVDANYPMPPASEVVDLLPSLQGVRGLAVKTDPATTVTEGMGYAMLTAGMQRDVETLKALTVAWQANGQAFGGQPACGGCCPSSDQQHVPAKESCASATLGGLCRLVPGAYMPGWRMPMGDSGSMGSATDADEDAITGLIYLAELLDDDEVRAYAVKARCRHATCSLTRMRAHAHAPSRAALLHALTLPTAA